ncbi:MAG: secretion protein [Candidatus Eisenbacteria bacterium]|uniref:Secretion protein n=1 Tax=Eiseniibacteriota bacterium TaxID=2212470 RepID=A0A956M5P5_UNCEI|nr:secretion protein [Candidatus Eisenbacteria bacterium]
MRFRLQPALMLALGVLLAGCQRVDVMSDLNEVDAVDLIVLLRQNGISATKSAAGSGQDVTWTIAVSPRDASNAFLVLAENDRPRPRPEGFADFFGNSKLIPTETEEKAMFLQAQAGELSRTIESMPGVIDARVHISIPEQDPLRSLMEGERPPVPRASVFVKLWAPERDAPEATHVTAQDIKTLVSGSVERLDASNVAVVLKSVVPTPAPAKGRGLDPTLLFYPLAALTLLLVILLAVLAVRNRSLSRQVSERPVQATGHSG